MWLTFQIWCTGSTNKRGFKKGHFPYSQARKCVSRKNVKTETVTVFPGPLGNTCVLPLEIHLWALSCLLWHLSHSDRVRPGPPSTAPLRISSVPASCLALVVQTVKRIGKIKGETSQSGSSELQTISLPPALKRMVWCLSAITHNGLHTVQEVLKKSPRRQ